MIKRKIQMQETLEAHVVFMTPEVKHRQCSEALDLSWMKAGLYLPVSHGLLVALK